MRQSTSSTQQHHSTIRSRGSLDSTTTNSSKQNGRQHHHQAITHIQLTSTRQRRTIPSNIDGTNQNTESPTTTKLQQNNHQQTPNSTMAGTTHSVLAQQVRNTRGRQHKLFPQMEQRPQSSNLNQFVSLEKQCNTYFQPSNNSQRWNNVSSKQFGLEETRQRGETLLDIGNKVVRARTIRCMPKPDKYDKQMFDIITGQAMTPPPTSQAQVQPTMVFHPRRRQSTTTETQTPTERATPTTEQKGGPQLPPKAITDTPTATTTPALASSPMATAPTSCHSRPAMPSPPKRQVADDIAEGSSTNTTTNRHTAAGTSPSRTNARTAETKVTIKTKQGGGTTAYSCERHNRATDRKNPSWTHTDGLDKQKTIEGMKQEILSMKQQQVYMEVDVNTLTPEQRKNIIQSRWVLRDKDNKVRTRIVAKGFTETINDLDDIYASTPIFCVLRTLLTLACKNGWIGITGEISTAFLHAAAAAAADLLHVPAEGVLQPGGQHRMEVTESNLWTPQQPKSMAETSVRSPSTNWTSPQHSGTQHLHDSNTQLLRLGLGRRPTFPWRGTDCQQALQDDSAAASFATNRNTVTRKHSSIPWKEHHQQRRPLRD